MRDGGSAGDATARVLAHPAVVALARALAARPGARAQLAPGDPAPRWAAVALVLRVGARDVGAEAVGAGDVGARDVAAADGLELLLVKRAEYPGDPWSGHVAFPGGRREPGDPDLWHTAARETREETGLDLLAASRPLGALDEIYPRSPVLPPIVVRPYVAVMTAPPGDTLVLSDELAGAFWVPLAHFGTAGVSADRVVVARGESLTVSSYAWGAHTVWGMTERILRQFLAVAGLVVDPVTSDTKIVRD